MISTYYDWTYEQVMNAVKDSNGEVTLDCQHTSITNMHQIVSWLESAGYSATISDDEERIYAKKHMTREDAMLLIGELGCYARANSWSDDYTQAVNMAIEALEHEPKIGH